MYIVFEIQGEPEKDLIATAVVANLKAYYPTRKIIVTTMNPEIWLHNPDVWRVYKLGITPYFFEEYIDQKDTLIFRHDPYNTTAAIQKKKHLSKLWSELIGILPTDTDPKFFPTEREKTVVSRIIERNKPLFMLQLGKNIPDIHKPFIERIVAEMNARGYHTFQILYPKQVPIIGAEPFAQNLRLSLTALEFSKARFFINSYAEHGAAAFGKSSVVQWIQNNRMMFGYALHTNLLGDTKLKEIINHLTL